LSTRWRKVLADLLGNRGRSILVTLSIALGAASIGTMLGARDLVASAITSGFNSVVPANASVFSTPLTSQLVEAVRTVTGVQDAQVRGVDTVHVQVRPDEWRDLRLYMLPDDPLRINIVRSETGAWPPRSDEVLLERSSLTYLHRNVGDTLIIQEPGGGQRQLRIAGTAYDLNQPPVTGTGIPLGYLSSYATASRIDQLDLRIDGNIDNTVAAVRQTIETGGGHVLDTFVPEPGKHPAYDGSQTMLVLLALIGGVMMFMAALLVTNTIAALLANQVRQIGVMKTLGAGSGQLLAMYLVTVLGFGLVALLVAVPVSLGGAWGLSEYALSVINFDAPPLGLPAAVLALMTVASLGVPAAAAAFPIRAAMRMSVREAIAGSNASATQFGAGPIDRAVERLRGLPRPILLSVRNTFRRKVRLWLTLATLVLAGSVFIAVLNVREALLRSIDDEFRYMAYDAQVTLSQAAPADQLERAVRGTEGVADVEAWAARSAYRVRPDGTESPAIAVTGPPADTRMMRPLVLEGRWLRPAENDGVVITSDLLQSEVDLRVGSDLALKIDGETRNWRVIGLVQTYRFDRQVGPAVFVERSALGPADTVQITTEQHDAANEARVASRVGAALDATGVQTRSTTTATARRATRDDVAGIILTFLVMMAVMLAIVGGLGLAGTMSMNVLERTREIGVMRAIGASDRDVMRIVLVEGLAIAVIAWIVGAVLALPVTGLLNGVVGQIFVHQTLPRDASTPWTPLLWLGFVLVLAIVSTLAPAVRAARVTVREALAYE
jgi:putative ABC transport system permease protein